MPTWSRAPPIRSSTSSGRLIGYRFSTINSGLADQYGWPLQAWAVFPNHYHFVAVAPDDPGSLRKLIRHLHSVTARESNRLDCTPGRQVLVQDWDTHRSFERSYLARLHYVHQNPVKHGFVREAREDARCSAAWLEREAAPELRNAVYGQPIDRISVDDAF